MTVDATVVADAGSPEVMASVDSTPHGDELIIADVGCDDAWVSMSAAVAPSLPDWR
jgi:hypothetical protein